uniref:Lipase n=1 Tax=Panagrellus redivivus TaxID=6233 RepID=A0A7E4VP39_PANRE
MKILCFTLLSFVVFSSTSADGTVGIGLSTPEIITRRGYPVESHTSITDDGYILTLHRIPYGFNGTNVTQPVETNATLRRPVVFLQHGLEGTSSEWVSNHPNLALAYILADAGFDVWMGNSRGNVYSRNHTILDTKSTEFWNFTWYDMSRHDLNASIDTVLAATGEQSLYYVGHSQGTTTMFTKLAEEPEFGSKVRKFFALAPVVTVGYIQGTMAIIASSMFHKVKSWYCQGSGQFPLMRYISPDFSVSACNIPIFGHLYCHGVLSAISGVTLFQIDATRIPELLADHPGGTSTKNIYHWMQMAHTGRYAAFDYGADANWVEYGQPIPPTFNLKAIKTDMHLFWSPSDFLADSTDVTSCLLPYLNPDYLVQNVQLANFGHLDFVYGDQAAAQIYHPIVNTINRDWQTAST